jgi:hypothetical protein
LFAVSETVTNDITQFSLLNHQGIAQKLRFEMAHTMVVVDVFNPVFTALQEICIYTQQNGLGTLHECKHKTDSRFLQNMLYIVSNPAVLQNGQSPFSHLSYWMLPTLLSGAMRGKAFIENMMYYEGLLMAASGQCTPAMIRFRLMGLLGIQLSLEECMKENEQ